MHSFLPDRTLRMLADLKYLLLVENNKQKDDVGHGGQDISHAKTFQFEEMQ